jgi:hypothetical protein
MKRRSLKNKSQVSFLLSIPSHLPLPFSRVSRVEAQDRIASRFFKSCRDFKQFHLFFLWAEATNHSTTAPIHHTDARTGIPIPIPSPLPSSSLSPSNPFRFTSLSPDLTSCLVENNQIQHQRLQQEDTIRDLR